MLLVVYYQIDGRLMQVKGVCVFEQLEFVIILRHQCEFVQIID